jgi:hypothetical protein
VRKKHCFFFFFFFFLSSASITYSHYFETKASSKMGLVSQYKATVLLFGICGVYSSVATPVPMFPYHNSQTSYWDNPPSLHDSVDLHATKSMNLDNGYSAFHSDHQNWYQEPASQPYLSDSWNQAYTSSGVSDMPRYPCMYEEGSSRNLDPHFAPLPSVSGFSDLNFGGDYDGIFTPTVEHMQDFSPTPPSQTDQTSTLKPPVRFSLPEQVFGRPYWGQIGARALQSQILKAIKDATPELRPRTVHKHVVEELTRDIAEDILSSDPARMERAKVELKLVKAKAPVKPWFEHYPTQSAQVVKNMAAALDMSTAYIYSVLRNQGATKEQMDEIIACGDDLACIKREAKKKWALGSRKNTHIDWSNIRQDRR